MLIWQDLELVLKEERDSSALTQETLEGQIDKEQKLAALHKHIADERTSKATELDGIVQQFKQHLKACRTARICSGKTTMQI